MNFITNEKQCPVCYSFLEIEDGAGYCFMCDEVIYESEEGLSSDLLEWINEQ